MGFVGLTEKFKESLALMKHYLGFTNLKYVIFVFLFMLVVLW